VGKLTVNGLNSEKKKKAGRYGDGDGLWLQVRDAEHRSWLFRYARAGRQRQMGLGPFPGVSLAEARELAEGYRKLLRAGKDPLEARKDARAAAAQKVKVVTFRETAAHFVASHEAGWRNAKHRAQWTSTLDTYVHSKFGDRAVDAIETGHVLGALEPIWTVKPETASRVRGRIEKVLDYAKARGWREGENPARWRGHLVNLLAPRGRIKAVEHHPALAWTEMAAFMAALRGELGWAARAFEFAILTAARTSEALGARWDEIDSATKVWTVPAARMKARREHRVPLSTPALLILDQARRFRTDGSPYVFPGARGGKPLSNMAMLMLLRRMNKAGEAPKRWVDKRTGEQITAHGFRSAFRDWAGEATSFPSDVAEAALAHVRSDKVEAAYARGDLIKKRADLMEAWGAFCASGASAGTTRGAVEAA
jgi:integrase